MTDAVFWGYVRKLCLKDPLDFPVAPMPGVPELNLFYSEAAKKYALTQEDGYKPCTFSSEGVVHAYWRLQLIPLLATQVNPVLLHQFTSQAIPASFTDDLKPDIVVYASKDCKIDFYILCIGNRKFGEDITSEHCGQLAKYAQALLERHPHRSHFYGWLATTSKIRFFKLTATDHDIGSIEMSHDFDYKDGLPRLCSMLRLQPSDLGVIFAPLSLDGSQYVPSQHLGRGNFATVYAALAPAGGMVAIKLFRAAVGHTALEHEESVLKQLAKGNVQGVPRLLGKINYLAAEAHATALVMQPVGVTLRAVVEHPGRYSELVLNGTVPPVVLLSVDALLAARVRELLDIIRDIHSAGFVHCDLSLSNMYFVKGSNGCVQVRLLASCD